MLTLEAAQKCTSLDELITLLEEMVGRVHDEQIYRAEAWHARYWLDHAVHDLRVLRPPKGRQFKEWMLAYINKKVLSVIYKENEEPLSTRQWDYLMHYRWLRLSLDR